MGVRVGNKVMVFIFWGGGKQSDRTIDLVWLEMGSLGLTGFCGGVEEGKSVVSPFGLYSCLRQSGDRFAVGFDAGLKPRSTLEATATANTNAGVLPLRLCSGSE